MSSKENAFVSGGKTMRDEANIEITPSAELEFIAPQGTKYSRADLTVKNNGDTSAAFKVKTTTPKVLSHKNSV